MTKRGVYRTQSTEVAENGNYRKVEIGCDKYNDLIDNRETFRYLRTYNFKPNWLYTEDTVTVSLTCRTEPRRQKYYYFAHWRQPGYGKNSHGMSKKNILRKTWLGERPTLAKLNEVCDKFYMRFCEDNNIEDIA